MYKRQACRPADAILSCVVPDLVDVWARALHAECGRRALVVGPGLKTGIRMRYRDPAEVGPDRVADLAAALADYGGPLVVVDLGTTTNFEVLDAEGTFLGGIIAPGLALGAKALSQAAARLPRVEPVSYTHLDVYKRQARSSAGRPWREPAWNQEMHSSALSFRVYDRSSHDGRHAKKTMVV